SSLDALVAAFGALPRQRPAHQFFVVHDQDFLPHHDRYFIILHEPLTGFVSRGTRLNYSTTLRALGISALLFSLFVASFDRQPLTSALLGVLVLGSQDPQPPLELRAAPWLARHLNSSLVRLHDASRQREPQARSFFSCRKERAWGSRWREASWSRTREELR